MKLKITTTPVRKCELHRQTGGKANSRILRKLSFSDVNADIYTYYHELIQNHPL